MPNPSKAAIIWLSNVRRGRKEGRVAMTISRSSVRELAIMAYEMGVGVLRGPLHRTEEGWAVGDARLEEWLEGYEGREVVLIAAPLGEAWGPATKTCGICGREYEGEECPHCREARMRLRGR